MDCDCKLHYSYRIFCFFFIKDLKIDNSVRQFLPQKSESYESLVETENQFGSMIVVGVSLEDKNGNILTLENIQVVKNITDRILELDQVDSIDSLTHIDYVCNQDGSISATQMQITIYSLSKEEKSELEKENGAKILTESEIQQKVLESLIGLSKKLN